MVLCVSPVSAKVLKVPGEHPTIHVAIAIASDGDTILIARGTYEHTTLNINKRLTLASDYMNTKDRTDIDETIIKATPAAKKQWFALNSKDSRIIGLTIIGNKNHTLKITSPYTPAAEVRPFDNAYFQIQHGIQGGPEWHTVGGLRRRQQTHIPDLR